MDLSVCLHAVSLSLSVSPLRLLQVGVSREVLLAAGAIGSPQILQLSGRNRQRGDPRKKGKQKEKHTERKRKRNEDEEEEEEER